MGFRAVGDVRFIGASKALERRVLVQGLNRLIGLGGSFRKLGVPYFGVLIIRILLFRVLY